MLIAVNGRSRKFVLTLVIIRIMEVTASLNNLRKSPRKVRLVAEVIKGLDVKEAESQLNFLAKGSAPNFGKLLKSAVANAENNFGFDKDNLFVKDVIVNEGAKLKRWLPRAYGRAGLVLKRTSNVEIILDEKIKGKGRKKVERPEIKEVEPEKVKKELRKQGVEVKEKAGEWAKKESEREFQEKKKPAGAGRWFRKMFRRKSM